MDYVLRGLTIVLDQLLLHDVLRDKKLIRRVPEEVPLPAGKLHLIMIRRGEDLLVLSI